MSRNRRVPVPVLLTAALSCLTLLAAAGTAQAAGGTAKAWGWNQYGQLGNGSNTGPDTCALAGCSTAPEPIAGLSGATEIDSNSYAGVGLLADGRVVAWGDNDFGMLGNGTTTDRYLAGPVGGISNAISVAAGGSNGLALLANGTVMAWGANARGALGIGSSTGPETCGIEACTKLPVQVPGLANVIAIDADYYFNLALLADGTVMAWGYDDNGQLGDGVGVLTGCRCVDHPVPVPGVAGATAISAGTDLALAQLGDGTVKAWGYNADGEVGNGTTSPPAGCECSPPVTVTGVSHPELVVAGGFHGLALNPSGSLQAWGYNEDGELGTGTTTGPEICGTSPCSKLPVPVPTIAGPQDLAAGDYHSLALNANGTVSAWGYNYRGQLGDGTTDTRSAPIPVPGLSGVSGVFAGEETSFAILGPSQALNVSLAGAGAGTVGGRRILCPANCDARYPQGQVEVLRATSTSGGFAGFSGPCSGIATCQLKLERDEAVVATFGVPKGTKIEKATIDGKRKRATFKFSAPGAITGYQCMLVKPKAKKRKKGGGRKANSSKRAKKPAFAGCKPDKAYKNLRPGKYTFRVRALDILGADATPAKRVFKVKPKKKHKPSRH